MFYVRDLLYVILLRLIIATPQINLQLTDWISQSKSKDDTTLQHNCLRIPLEINERNNDLEIISYCMGTLPPKIHVEKNDLFPKFTFDELSKENISSQQLYLWSVPIDIIEHYQFYLNQLSTTNNLSLAKQVFYNCTLPRFGPMCQYELYSYDSQHSSLFEIVRNFYEYFVNKPINLTCYIHLQCNRGPSPSCLDWSEICDGKVDCLDGKFDEEHCWQLEINECKDNEYRCGNGQCIPKSFYQDHYDIYDCIDGSDGSQHLIPILYKCSKHEPSFGCEDVMCTKTPLTSSCMSDRGDLLLKAMYSIKNNSVSENCWSALKCIFNIPHLERLFCRNLCAKDACINIILHDCPDMLYIPNIQVLFGHVYLAFGKNVSQYMIAENSWVLYICYNNSLNDVFSNMVTIISFNNRTCFIYETIPYISINSSLSGSIYHISLDQIYNKLKKYHLNFNYNSKICNRSSMYQCINSSKCISIYRLIDGIDDCPYMDDENMTIINNTNLIKQLERTHFKCQTFNTYIPRSLVNNDFCDCGETEDNECDDEIVNKFNFKKDISFHTICDAFVELLPVPINGQNETDETECNQWECNNLYTHCDGIWNCPNGADETGCDSMIPLNCSLQQHVCILSDTIQFMCLSIEKVNDGNIDCLGGTDEPILCRLNESDSKYQHIFHCRNQTSQSCISPSKLCNNYEDCQHGDDEQFCQKNRTYPIHNNICSRNYLSFLSDIEKFLCKHMFLRKKRQSIDFLLDGISSSIEYSMNNNKNTMFSSLSMIEMSNKHQRRCHRGFDLYVWLSNKNQLRTTTCLCPPSFYGTQCQYQNQRISLTIKFRALSDSWQTLFIIVISLIDDSDQRIIHSYEQLTYFWIKNCKTKFNIYLIYSNRPKDSTKNYAIHIDIYEKISLTYRGSLLLPVKFSFLPVHRLAYIVDIPRSDNKSQSCSNEQCIHGKCIRYSNNSQNLTFCQCDEGWSGRYCTVQHICTCAFGSLCIGVSPNNRSICICSMNKFGPQCLLIDTICQTNDNLICQNGGQCISNDDYFVFNRKFTCICQKGFHGDRCQIVDNKLILSFDKNIIVSQLIFIHFIDLSIYSESVRLTTFRNILFKQDLIMVNWSKPFHLVFIQLLDKNYYLTVLQKVYNVSTTINKMIKPSDRCPNISELFNETFFKLNLLRRIKYYHLPCQNQSLNLSCFHDDVHFCLCYEFGQKRLANCLNFNHNMTYDCEGQSECENNAQCLQDHLTCPGKSICICSSCSYGSRCQFSTSGFGLSLDAIIGYHILPYLSLTQQPAIVQFSLALTIIFIMAGLINGILSIITFKNKIIREVGCGLYLLGSSITTLLTTCMFGLKFLILILVQMTIISNRTFLQIQCYSLDFILRVCLNMDQWLNACVAADRAFATIKRTSFVKKKSKQAAKFVILILLIVIIGTFIHDPIHRHLIDEENDDEKRIWCIVRYSSSVTVYNYIIHIFHFFGPFLINLISSIILITNESRQQAIIHKQRPYKEILREQFQLHKNLLIAPSVLVILALSRLIIAFVSKCMKSTDDAWLFIIGYFISFIPSLLTFIIFVLPSQFYTKEFYKSIVQLRTNIQRCLHRTPHR